MAEEVRGTVPVSFHTREVTSRFDIQSRLGEGVEVLQGVVLDSKSI
jgi:hypothetical protein